MGLINKYCIFSPDLKEDNWNPLLHWTVLSCPRWEKKNFSAINKRINALFFSKRKTLKAPPSRKLPHLFQLQLFCIFTSRWQRAGTWIFIREEAASHFMPFEKMLKENKTWWHLSTGLRVFLFGLFGNSHYLLQSLCFCLSRTRCYYQAWWTRMSAEISALRRRDVTSASTRRQEKVMWLQHTLSLEEQSPSFPGVTKQFLFFFCTLSFFLLYPNEKILVKLWL